ncbi:MAG: transposase [bacterium]|nr:transposase [bacterium]
MDYGQEFLLPPSLEDWVSPSHPARFIREFVDALDLAELGITWAPGERGRPAYAAGLLLKVWPYGYYERIRSTRKLGKACRDHIGFLWLTRRRRAFNLRALCSIPELRSAEHLSSRPFDVRPRIAVKCSQETMSAACEAHIPPLQSQRLTDRATGDLSP